MSFLRFFFINLVFVVGWNTAWSQNRISISGGLPLSYGQMAFDKAYLFEASYTYYPNERSGFGLGLSHIKSDLPSDGIVLTYDRISTNFYLLYNYRLPLASRFILLPEAQLGYAFTEGTLKMIGDSEKASGVFLGATCSLLYRFSTNLEALLGVGYSHVFDKYEVRGYPLPAIYIRGHEGAADFFQFKLGLIYNFSL